MNHDGESKGREIHFICNNSSSQSLLNMKIFYISFIQLGIQLASKSIHFHESCYSFESFKECIVQCRIVFCLVELMLPSLLSCHPMFKGKFESLPLQSKKFLSQSYGYIIYNILELCFEFRVVNVGFFMALLRQEYSCRHHLIIHELVLDTSLVP